MEGPYFPVRLFSLFALVPFGFKGAKKTNQRFIGYRNVFNLILLWALAKFIQKRARQYLLADPDYFTTV